MESGVLGTIFKRLSNKYGNEAFNILNDYGDDITSKGMDSVLGRHVSGKKMPDPLLVGHQLTQGALEHADDALGGYLINPSIQATNGKPIASTYGEIYLLGNKGMFNPNNPGVNPYPRDIFSPRFPMTQPAENGGVEIIAETGKRAYPHNLSEAMNMHPITNSGNTTYNGAIAAERAQPLSGVAGALDAQDVLDPLWYSDAIGAENKRDRLMWNLRNDPRIVPREGEYPEHAAGRYIGDMLRGDDPAGLLNDEKIRQAVDEISQGIDNAKSGYMESKITRPVKLSEFTGALIPDYMLSYDQPNTQKIRDILNKHGITDISTYNTFDRQGTMMSPMKYQSATAQFINDRLKTKNLAERFKTPYLMGAAGALPAAGVLGSLFNGGNDQQPSV